MKKITRKINFYVCDVCGYESDNKSSVNRCEIYHDCKHEYVYGTDHDRIIRSCRLCYDRDLFNGELNLKIPEIQKMLEELYKLTQKYPKEY